MADQQPLVLTYQEAADILRLSERSVRTLVAGGFLTAVHPTPGTTRIRAADLQDYINRLEPTRARRAAR